MIRSTVSVSQFVLEVYGPSRLNLGQRALQEVLRTARQIEEWHGQLSPTRLSDDLICGFLRARMRAGDSPATVNGKRARLLAIWRCAWRKRLTDELPRDVPRLREPTDPPHARRVDELEQLLRHCATLEDDVAGLPARWWWTSLYLTLWSTAARVGSVLQTPMTNYDQTHGILRIDSGTTKTGEGRVYALRPEAASALDHIYSPKRKLLWPWPHCRRYFFSACRKVMLDAGLTCSKDTKDLTYSIKRSSLSYTAAVELELARKQAGHSSVELTRRHYIDPTIADQRQASDVLPALVVPDDDSQLRLF